jgi:DNA-binding transcriptional ArsR family regulator
VDRAESVEYVHELEAGICRALADRTRLRIIYALADGPLSVGCLSRQLELPQPTVSRHLRVLRDQWLVATVHEGALVHYHLTDSDVLDALGTLRGILVRTLDHRAHDVGGLEARPL